MSTQSLLADSEMEDGKEGRKKKEERRKKKEKEKGGRIIPIRSFFFFFFLQYFKRWRQATQRTRKKTRKKNEKKRGGIAKLGSKGTSISNPDICDSNSLGQSFWTLFCQLVISALQVDFGKGSVEEKQVVQVNFYQIFRFQKVIDPSSPRKLCSAV